MIRRKGMLISVSGMDGSGKSTLTKSFVNLMQKRGVDFKRVYGNYEGYVLRPFRTVGRFMFLKNQDINKNYINYCTTKRRAFGKYSFVYWLHCQIRDLEYYVQVFFKIIIPLILGRNVVCDRYYYDVAINYSVNYGHSLEEVAKMMATYGKVLPNPDVSFLIDVPEKVAFKRKDDIPALSYLKDRRGLYKEVGKKYDMQILDGTDPRDVLLTRMCEKVSTLWQTN